MHERALLRASGFAQLLDVHELRLPCRPASMPESCPPVAYAVHGVALPNGLLLSNGVAQADSANEHERESAQARMALVLAVAAVVAVDASCAATLVIACCLCCP